MDEIICERCKCKTEKKSNSQKYCPSCSYVVYFEKCKKAANLKRQKTEGTFGAHPIKNKRGNINFKAEHKAIIKEMVRLGLRRND